MNSLAVFLTKGDDEMMNRRKILMVYEALELWHHSDRGHLCSSSLGFFQERAFAERLSRARSRASSSDPRRPAVQERQALILRGGRSFLLAISEETWEGRSLHQPIGFRPDTGQRYEVEAFAVRRCGGRVLLRCDLGEHLLKMWNGKGTYPGGLVGLPMRNWFFAISRLFVLADELCVGDFRLFCDSEETVRGWIRSGHEYLLDRAAWRNQASQ